MSEEVRPQRKSLSEHFSAIKEATKAANAAGTAVETLHKSQRPWAVADSIILKEPIVFRAVGVPHRRAMIVKRTSTLFCHL